MLVPAVYGYKEALITKTNSVERGVQLTYASVVITDEDGTQIDTAAAAQKGWFTIEIESWTCFPVQGSRMAAILQ